MSSNSHLALTLLKLMSPVQIYVLREVLAAPRGVDVEAFGARGLLDELEPLEGLLKLSGNRLSLLDASLRPAFRSALKTFDAETDPVGRVRNLLASQEERAALACLTRNGGAFISMIHGLAPARRVLEIFPDRMRKGEPLLLMLEVVNAMKSGQIARADLLAERVHGQNRLPDLEMDQSRLDPSFVTFRFVKAIYEDEPIGQAAVDELYRTLARLPDDSIVERGLLYHVALDVYIRRRDWAEARQSALRALYNFDRAQARALSFYTHLYLAIIDISLGDFAAARASLKDASHMMHLSQGLTENDHLLFASFDLILRYETGDVQPWINHLLTAEASVPFGELWPAVAEPILAYGRRALTSHATFGAALAWIHRWRIQQKRSDRFETLITVQEVMALQGARRWQEADELLGTITIGDDPTRRVLELKSRFEAAPKSPSLANELDELCGDEGLAVRQRAELQLLRSQAALARKSEEEAGNALSDLTQTAPPNRFVTFYREQRTVLTEICDNRLMRPVLKRRPRLGRQIAEAMRDTTVPDNPVLAGLTRQERRILSMLGEGLPNRTIAQRMGLALPTVKFHLSNLYAKLGCANRRDAVNQAVNLGALPK